MSKNNLGDNKINQQIAKAEKNLEQLKQKNDAKLIFKGGKRYQEVAPGEYVAYVFDIKRSNFMGKQTITFCFRIITDDEAWGVELNGYVNAQYESFTKHTKLGEWWEILTGEEIEEDTVLDVNKFRDQVFEVEVKQTKSKFKNQFSNVKTLLKHCGDINTLFNPLSVNSPRT